ncbi:hypothetical protein BaRGS_00019009 [Batillaria attramentaria]|uniref:Uncharacterized protein n=1 Tax=Batillaria attramentaria TaxID=370345 RepID=A0ABD0KR09_9CAEN
MAVDVCSFSFRSSGATVASILELELEEIALHKHAADLTEAGSVFRNLDWTRTFVSQTKCHLTSCDHSPRARPTWVCLLPAPGGPVPDLPGASRPRAKLLLGVESRDAGQKKEQGIYDRTLFVLIGSSPFTVISRRRFVLPVSSMSSGRTGWDLQGAANHRVAATGTRGGGLFVLTGLPDLPA